MGLCGNDPPDPAKGYVAGIHADLESLPARRLIEAMARLGEAGYVDLPTGRGNRTTRQYYDFTGLGEADYMAQYGEQMTEQLLAIQREFGPQYVEQRLAELERSDPEGAAMRRRLWGNIKAGVEAGPTDRPGAEALQAQVLAELEAGSRLTDAEMQDVSQGALGVQTSRGNWLGNAAASQEAGAVNAAGEAKKTSAQQAALAFLTGGVSPEDVANREQMQNLSNLGAFMAGETPVAQFGQLSGAQGGAAPFMTSGGLPGINQNAGWDGIAERNAIYGINQQAGGVNPWVAGLSGALNGVNTWLNLGGGFGKTPAAGAGGAGLQGGWNGGFGGQFAGQV
jgi:hypothetical protein